MPNALADCNQCTVHQLGCAEAVASKALGYEPLASIRQHDNGESRKPEHDAPESPISTSASDLWQLLEQLLKEARPDFYKALLQRGIRIGSGPLCPASHKWQMARSICCTI